MIGRLHCGVQRLGINILEVIQVARPMIGRLHCGRATGRPVEENLGVARPMIGRLHCGALQLTQSGTPVNGRPADDRPAPLRPGVAEDALEVVDGSPGR